MAGPQIGYAISARAQSDTDPLDVATLDALVRTADASGAIVFDGRAFAIARERIGFLSESNQALVVAAAARANVDPAVQNLLGPAGHADKVTIEDAIKAVVAKFKDASRIADDAIAFFRGVEAHAHWWGVELFLTKASGDALANIVSTDLQAAMVLLQLIGLPIAKAVALVVGIVGEVLAKYIRIENGGSDGIKITLYMFILPHITSRS